MRRTIAVVISLYFCLLLSAASAQSTDAVVTGTVLDPSGAAVAAATVSVHNMATGVVTNTRSNEAGVYLFAALPPGTYRLVAEHQGFQKYADEGVVLEVGARLNINVPLAIGSTSETLEVKAQAETLETNTSTVSAVVTNEKLLDLPLVGRSAYDLINLQAGVQGDNGQNVNGTRAGMLNLMLDGVNIRNTHLDALVQATSIMVVSVDRVQEFRMITAPADAEYGRGAGQMIGVSRTGSNHFHGALFEENRISALSANTWFNNQRGNDPTTGQAFSPVNFLEKNQFGGRIGGPIRRNKTFFNLDYEGSRELDKTSSTSLVYTATARQGIYRYYPGVRNANAIAAVPTVDLNGNPVAPAGATGGLQSVSLFGRDPNRMTPDQSGIITHMLSYMPPPNNFRVGDGLNIAGYTFRQRAQNNPDAGDVRLDHIINDSHRLGMSYSRQQATSLNYLATQVQNFPGAPAFTNAVDTRLWSLSLTSVLRPTLLNEFRAGVYRPSRGTPEMWSADPNYLPKASGLPFVPRFTNVSDPVTGNAYGNTDGQWHVTPGYQLGDNLTWLKGRHSFKGGFSVRFNSDVNKSAYVTVPRATLGATTIPVQNVNATTLPGLGSNQAPAQQMLAELSGSVQSAVMYLNSAGGANPVFTPGLWQYQHYREPEFDWFFKDDLKLRPNLTLNLGVRYEWYGVPVEVNGMGLAPVGGTAGVFGISGTNMGALFQPGLSLGSLTQLQQIGPKTPNPNTQLWNNNNRNFAPAVGVTWAVPGNTFLLGKGKTVLRAGFMMNYQNLAIGALLTDFGANPGYTNVPNVTFSTMTSVANLQLPLAPTAQPLAGIPLTDRNSALWATDDHLKPGYYENWNFSIQRALPKNLVVEARYVGTKGVHLVRAVSINEVNIFENGILDAFKVTQAGGNSPLFDKIFMGIGGVNGTTVTGSSYLRSNATTAAFLAQNNPGGLASFLNSNTLAGKPGDLLRRAGLPENFVVVNPQFGSDWLFGNFGNSFYNALQLELTKRFSSGWTLQGNYSWSKALGDEATYNQTYNTSFRTLRDRSLDKRILDFNRTHVLRVNSIYELPFGPGKMLGRNAHGVLARVIGGWQAGAILTMRSGAPFSLYAVNAFNTGNSVDDPASPMLVGSLPKGQLKETGSGPVYFSGLQQVREPYLIATPGLQAQSTLLAIADASGKVLMINPAAGQMGNIAPDILTGPGFFDLDLNLMKRIKIAERMEFVIRCDAVNATNTPSFGVPATTISNPGFGNITGTSSGPRIIVFGGRLNF